MRKSSLKAEDKVALALSNDGRVIPISAREKNDYQNSHS